MISEKKIFLNKIDELSSIVDRLIKEKAERIILNIPRDSVLGLSIHNFQVLKRESGTAGKELIVESVDDHILELAGLVGLKATNPVFKTRERSFSDILPRVDFEKKASQISDLQKKVFVETPAESKKEELKPKLKPKTKEEAAIPIAKETVHIPKGSKSFSFRKLIFSFVLLVLLAAGIWFVFFFLPKADIKIILEKTPASFNEIIEVSSKTKEADLSGIKIILPGELFIANQNLQMVFDATGKENIDSKSTGVLTVYNAYGSQSQTLVKNTRFESPEKKIFRLISQVTIPGAKVVDGKIVPSKVDVQVLADVPGVEYNLPPTKNWRIPGFKDTPRYEGFYAESVNSMTGGFIGERSKPTEEDLTKARNAIRQTLEDSLKNQANIMMKDRFKLLPGASVFKIKNESIENQLENNPGKFGIYNEAELRLLVFEENVLRDAVELRTKKSLSQGLKVFDFGLTYGKPEVDLTQGKLTVSATGDIVFGPDLNYPEIEKNLLGKDESMIKGFLFSLPGLEKATISLWPFWVKKVPGNTNRVKVTFE